eukprot:EC096684.1.p3 GENE.EC096684.1~~EC096684.1.p3  ORF type:complete len:128 (+),score=7.01 EC096684.1:1-384(+)
MHAKFNLVDGNFHEETFVQLISEQDVENVVYHMMLNKNMIQLQSSGGHTPEILNKLNQLISDASGGKLVHEAQVVLVVGDSFQMAGFPPWLTRLSEFFQIGNINKLTDNSLKKVFSQYKQKIQRFGQ